MATERRVTEEITQSKDPSPKKSQLKGGEKQRGQSHPVTKFQESLNTVFREPLFVFTVSHCETALANQTTHYNVKEDYKSRKQTKPPKENEKSYNSPLFPIPEVFQREIR